MFDLDHMLNGKHSRDHVNEVVKQAELNNRLRKAQAKADKPQSNSFRVILASVVNLMARGV